MTECYRENLCVICRKKNCDKRTEKYTADRRNKPCDGMCYTCINAIHDYSAIDKEPFKSVYNLRICAMYYLQKHQGIKFYGRIGEDSYESEIEQAISQVLKCESCVFESSIKVINKLSNGSCFMCKEGSLIEDSVLNDKDLEACTFLKEVEKGVISVLSNNICANVNEICNYLKQVVSNIFFIHELTIMPVIFELINQNRIVKCGDKKYSIRL